MMFIFFYSHKHLLFCNYHSQLYLQPDIQTLSYNPSSIKPEEYFDDECDLEERDIGRPIEQSSKAQRFKATLWLCEDYPLSLPEQVVPIIDLMAASNAHFKKLRDFVTLQLPAGFPVKIGELFLECKEESLILI